MSLSASRLADGRIDEEQRFRASLIASVSVHLTGVLALILVPLLFGRTVIMPTVLPVQVLPPSPPSAPAEQPAAAQEPEPEPEQPEPEPVEAVTSEPEPVPRSIEELRRQQQQEAEAAREETERRQREEQERRREEEQRRQEEEEQRRREEEEERRRREEEARARPQRASRTPRTQTASREAIDITGTEESQTSFTVEDFPFAAYLMLIRDMVAARWDPPARGQYAPELRGEVFFRIGRDGHLVVQPRMLDGSSHTLFDQAAMRAIARAAPFPPLPREYQGQSLGVRFAFIHE